MMKKYIGAKALEAKPMKLGDYNLYKGWTIPHDEDPLKDGYLVKYSDDYESWSPKEVFEQAYMQIGDNNTITQENVAEFITDITDYKMGEKTTVIQVELANGFVITDSSSCVDPKNYDAHMGYTICMDRIESKVWELLGFFLQTATKGIKK